MKESATIMMAQKARELAEKGYNVINLSLGEPDFDTPAHIKEAAKKALDEGHTKYTPVPGILTLREAISKKFLRDNDLLYTPDQIVVSNGAKQSIANVMLSVINPGDEVIVLSPYWVSYIEIIRLAGGIPVVVSAGIERDFKISGDQLKAALTEKTKALIFSSPCNPTGSVYEREELEALAQVLREAPDVLVLSDEIYEYINFISEHVSIASLPGMKERTVTINGFSKGFSMTGWRLGYIGAPLEIAKACAKIQGQFTSGANSFSQVAAITALEADMQPTYEMKAAFLDRRKLMLDLIEEIPGLKCHIPHGAFYLFPDISELFGMSSGDYQINSAKDFAFYCLETAHVAFVDGTAFGAPNCIRISYAASNENLIEAMKRIYAAVKRLS
jgi:aspartate aminotransferase